MWMLSLERIENLINIMINKLYKFKEYIFILKVIILFIFLLFLIVFKKNNMLDIFFLKDIKIWYYIII